MKKALTNDMSDFRKVRDDIERVVVPLLRSVNL